MSAPPRYYWDTSCFISYLSATEEWHRNGICVDVMKHAREGNIQIYTSCWTLVETIRPKERFIPTDLPVWAKALDQVDKEGKPLYAGAQDELRKIWDYYGKNTAPARLLPPHVIEQIKGMFAWSWIRKIQVVPTIAQRAAEISRQYNMKPADSLHVASALARDCEYLHRWDRDYEKTDVLIKSTEPVRISPPDLLSDLPAPV